MGLGRTPPRHPDARSSGPGPCRCGEPAPGSRSPPILGRATATPDLTDARRSTRPSRRHALPARSLRRRPAPARARGEQNRLRSSGHGVSLPPRGRLSHAGGATARLAFARQHRGAALPHGIVRRDAHRSGDPGLDGARGARASPSLGLTRAGPSGWRTLTPVQDHGSRPDCFRSGKSWDSGPGNASPEVRQRVRSGEPRRRRRRRGRATAGRPGAVPGRAVSSPCSSACAPCRQCAGRRQRNL